MMFEDRGYAYEVLDDWAKLPEGKRFQECTDVAVDPDDKVYVFNRGKDPVMVFDRDGNFLYSWGRGMFNRPHGITYSPDGTFFCTDDYLHTVTKCSPNGETLITIGIPGQPAECQSGYPFNRPTNVALDRKTGDIFISDGYGNSRVHKYSPDGEYLLSWGQGGTEPGMFNIVHDIESDTDGRIYVADRENHRVQIFDTEGKYLDQWKNMHRACGIYLDLEEGICYIGELGTDLEVNQSVRNIGPRLSLYDLKGNLLARFGDNGKGEDPGQFVAPHGIVVDSRKDIYVAEVSYSQLGRRLDPPREVRSFRKLVRKKKPS